MLLNVIKIKGACQHNLNYVDVILPRNKLVVITGLSGSGKSTLAFDTIYAEGQRRYVESMSSYARQFLERLEKPKVELIEGLSPSIAIEQKTSSHNPRSTIGTVTEINDFLRLLYAKCGLIYCNICGKKIDSKNFDQVVDEIMLQPKNSRFIVLSPIEPLNNSIIEQQHLFYQLQNDGFTRIYVNKKIIDLEDTKERLTIKDTDLIDIVIDRLTVKENMRKRLTDSMELAIAKSGGQVKIMFIKNDISQSEHSINFSENPICLDCHVAYSKLLPANFAFNSPHGACQHCNGMGTTEKFSLSRIVPNENLSLREGAVLFWENRKTTNFSEFIDSFAKSYDCDIYTPYHLLPTTFKKALMYGTLDPRKKISAKLFNAIKSEAIIPKLKKKYKEAKDTQSKRELRKYIEQYTCSKCKGSRLKKLSRFVKINKLSISELTAMTISEIQKFFLEYSPKGKTKIIADKIIKEITERLSFLEKVGLSYLALDRPAHTLSGGESQRIRLATQIGSKLTGVLYVLDEPSIGLHPRDNCQLISALTKMKNIGNSVIIVEHDEEIIMSSDHVVELGPGAGSQGGSIVFQGTPQQMLQDKNSLTGRYFSKKIKIDIPEQRRKIQSGKITIKNVTKHNLKNINVTFPLGILTCVTGVSGSGKSTLVFDILYLAAHRHINMINIPTKEYSSISGLSNIDKMLNIDQSSIGKTPRSNPATYTGTLSHIRNLLAETRDSRLRGYTSGRFSFNVKGGRCETCKGEGVVKIEMHFLPDVYVTCDICKGKQYNRETLDIKYKGKNISQILNLTVDEALSFFNNIKKISNILKTLSQIGLGYLKIGQPATTLSGGESQRVKLARELSKTSTGKTLYILDEPTTGLHHHDISKLLQILDNLINRGNTVVIIEHNLEVIKTADYIIDLGPEGGEKGGEIIGEGTPEHLCRIKKSYTGRYLKKFLCYSNK